MSEVAKAKIPPGLLPGPKVIHVEATLSEGGEFFFDFDTGIVTQSFVPEADVAFFPPLSGQPFLNFVDNPVVTLGSFGFDNHESISILDLHWGTPTFGRLLPDEVIVAWTDKSQFYAMGNIEYEGQTISFDYVHLDGLLPGGASRLPAVALERMSRVAESKLPPHLQPELQTIHVAVAVDTTDRLLFDLDGGVVTQTFTSETDLAFQFTSEGDPFLVGGNPNTILDIGGFQNHGSISPVELDWTPVIGQVFPDDVIAS